MPGVPRLMGVMAPVRFNGLNEWQSPSRRARACRELPGANLFSLVTTARVNDVEPFAYLSYLFERLPMASIVEELWALLPWNAKAALPS